MTWGLVARYGDAAQLTRVAAAARAAGYRDVDAYSPYPIHGLAEALGERHTRLASLVLIAGVLGGVGAFVMQVWMNAVDYPLNVGSRPLISWQAFIVPTFECVILAAAIACVLGLLGLCGLPSPYHPLFGAPGFELATSNGFFLAIEATDPRFDLEGTRRFLEEHHALEISTIAA